MRYLGELPGLTWDGRRYFAVRGGTGGAGVDVARGESARGVPVPIEPHVAQLPVDPRVLKRLKMRRKKFTKSKECGVCGDDWADITSGAISLTLPCGHSFHNACIDPWLSRTGSCPTCRAPVDIALHVASQHASSQHALTYPYRV